jgi:hypothetical protein
VRLSDPNLVTKVSEEQIALLHSIYTQRLCHKEWRENKRDRRATQWSAIIRVGAVIGSHPCMKDAAETALRKAVGPRDSGGRELGTGKPAVTWAVPMACVGGSEWR